MVIAVFSLTTLNVKRTDVHAGVKVLSKASLNYWPAFSAVIVKSSARISLRK